MSQSKPINCPEPIPGRTSHVGGIESITLDGQRYFFGFDFSNDWVISPLIENIDAMTTFASQYMEQTDGSHEPSYWRELADISIEMSELASEDGERTFSTEQLQQIAASLQLAWTKNVAIPNFEISYHMRYLLSAASEWPDPFSEAGVAAALSRLRLDPEELTWDCIDASIAILNCSQALPATASYADAALVVREYLRRVVCEAPGNWRAHFSSLAPE